MSRIQGYQDSIGSPSVFSLYMCTVTCVGGVNWVIGAAATREIVRPKQNTINRLRIVLFISKDITIPPNVR